MGADFNFREWGHGSSTSRRDARLGSSTTISKNCSKARVRWPFVSRLTAPENIKDKDWRRRSPSDFNFSIWIGVKGFGFEYRTARLREGHVDVSRLVIQYLSSVRLLRRIRLPTARLECFRSVESPALKIGCKQISGISSLVFDMAA